MQICASDRSWPAYFGLIRCQLAHQLRQADVPFIEILHIGSTSVPGLASKNNIDIVILVNNATTAHNAAGALTYHDQYTLPNHYERHGDGGIRGRISLKFHDHRDRVRQQPRSVYIVHKQDEYGMLGLDSYLDLKRVLKENDSLRAEYEATKFRLVQECADRVTVKYGQGKNQIIAKILRAAGWTDEKIAAKEALDRRRSRSASRRHRQRKRQVELEKLRAVEAVHVEDVSRVSEEDRLGSQGNGCYRSESPGQPEFEASSGSAMASEAPAISLEALCEQRDTGSALLNNICSIVIGLLLAVWLTWQW